VAAFVVLGAVRVLGFWPGGPAAATAWTNLTGHGGWLPHGWVGLAPALLLVLFSYAGTGVIGMAAAETRDPPITLRQAVQGTTALAGFLYLGTVLLLLSLVPWSRLPVTSSPLVRAVAVLRLPYGAGVMNLVLLFAVLSTMNAALYANARVLYALAAAGQAPAPLGRLHRRGLPANATWASAALLTATIALAYLLPHRAYAILVTATGFQAMFIWLVVLCTHLRYRRYLERRREAGGLAFRLPGYPLSTYLPIAIVLVGLGGAFLRGGETIGAAVGFAGVAAAAAAWWAVRTRLGAAARDGR
jgi:L-asparagine transporter-like permease